MKTTLIGITVLAVTSLTVNAALVESRFMNDTEGWVVADLRFDGPYTTPLSIAAPTFVASNGNPAGHIEWRDQTGQAFYFQAPAAYLGDKSAAYGSTLEWDIRAGFISGRISDASPDVVLVGNGMTLVLDVGPAPPLNIWTRFTAVLRESSGWRKDTTNGPAPTQAEFRAVLASLTALRIKGEYVDGDDIGALDNVTLTTPCPVASIRVSQVEICWASESNVTYRVEYRSDLTTNTWTLLTNIVAASQQTCITDTVVRGTPQRFYRVVCPTP